MRDALKLTRSLIFPIITDTFQQNSRLSSVKYIDYMNVENGPHWLGSKVQNYIFLNLWTHYKFVTSRKDFVSAYTYIVQALRIDQFNSIGLIRPTESNFLFTGILNLRGDQKNL